jgi:glyceraldehyde 3-phosphate dehydrogenase
MMPRIRICAGPVQHRAQLYLHLQVRPKLSPQYFRIWRGKLGGAGIRVPVLNGSLTDFTCSLKTIPTVAEINAAFKKAADGPMKNILEYTEDPIVSTDILDNPHSCIFDAQLTSVVGGLVKVVGWYDNEVGYSSRLADLLEEINELHHDPFY